MKELYVTITGFKHYYGQTPFQVGRKIKCVKEPDNPYDTEAIRATMKHIGTVGYIANSPYTTAGYVHTLEKPSKIKENRHSNTPGYAILYAKFFENP